MATFKFGRTIDLHWNGYDIQGPAETVFSIPDQLYEEFDADIAPVEPTLVWIDTNEFLTLSNNVSVSQLNGTFPISVTTTTSGKNVSISSSTNPAGYTMVADGSGGVIFQAGSTGALNSIVGVSPISTIISGNTASVLLNANYQTAGTYVTGVSGTAPITASGTTSITVGIDQTALSVADASTATTLRTYVKNSSGSTITKGQVVYITGADGTNALIGLASASTDATSSKTLGIAANTMTNNAFGYVIENGQLSNIDTSAASAGSSVWLGATPGSIVFDAPPAEPNHAVYLGVVTKANVSTGEILVKVQNGYELNELHDVFTTGVSTALPLVYNAASDGWVAQALTSVGIATGAVGSAQIAAGAVDSAALANNAVVAAKIASAAVGSAAIAASAVGSAAIAAGAVNTSAINSGSATNGQILTANGSGAASFSTITTGGVTLIATATLSASTSIQFASIPGTYKHLVITAPSLTQSLANVGWGIRFNSSTVSYTNFILRPGNGSATYGTGSTVASYIGGATGSIEGVIIGIANTTSGSINTSLIEIYNYTNSLPKLCRWTATGSQIVSSYERIVTIGQSIWNVNDAITQIDIIRLSTQSVTGTIYLYGVS